MDGTVPPPIVSDNPASGGKKKKLATLEREINPWVPSHHHVCSDHQTITAKGGREGARDCLSGFGWTYICASNGNWLQSRERQQQKKERKKEALCVACIHDDLHVDVCSCMLMYVDVCAC
jgi:hypothetical protein